MQLLLIPEELGTQLSRARVSAILTQAAKAVWPQVLTRSVAFETGGDGLLETMRSRLGGQYVVLPVMGPCGTPVSARYLSAGDTAVIAASEAAGSQHRQPGFSALNTTTYGVGELIAHALSAGHRKVWVGMGQTFVADAGCGMAAALGVRFLNRQGKPFLPMGATLEQIDKIAPNRFFLSPNAHTISVLVDHQQTLSDPKTLKKRIRQEPGITDEHVTLLEAGLRHLADTIRRQGGERIHGVAGGAAGGGAAAGLFGMIRANIVTDIKAFLAKSGMELSVDEADIAVAALETLDVARLTDGSLTSLLEAKAPVKVLFTTELPDDLTPYYKAGITAVFPIAFKQGEATLRRDSALTWAANNLFRVLAVRV